MKRRTILGSVLVGAALLWTGTASAADYTLKLGVATPSDHPHSVSAREFAKLVKDKTGGKVRVRVFDNASLGSNPELMDGVKTGVIDMCVNTPGVMAEYDPVTGLLELPYLFADKAHMMTVTRGPIGQQIADDYAKNTGIRIVGYFGGAQRNMITSTKPIESIDDLSGMKMRTWEWSVMLNWWKDLGAIGSVVAFPEVYTALQTGVVDGAENEFTTFTVARWAEMAKNIALTQHNITVRPLVVSEKSLAELPADLQEAVKQAALEAADFDVALEGELDEKNMAKLKADYGMTFTTPDKTPFIERSIGVVKAFAKEKGITSVADKILAASK